MRHIAVCLCTLMLAGCGVELLTTTATQAKLQTEQMKAMRGQIDAASSVAARANIERALQTYKAEKGANPPSIEALVPDYLPSLPAYSFGYDPVTGKLADGPGTFTGVPAADTSKMATPQDIDTMSKIYAAIQQFGTATGYFPNSLDDLAPTYLPKPPRTSAGEPFLYNNQNGVVTHPRSGDTTAPFTSGQTTTTARAAGAGGSGPMGEVMTGVGMQQQLNSNSSAGVSAAGSYSREAARGTSNQYSDNQNKVMDNLGL